MTKSDPTEAMFKAEFEGEGDIRKAALLTGNLGYLMALEANGLDRKASELVAKIDAGLSRKPKAARVEGRSMLLPDDERGRSAADLAQLDAVNARLAQVYQAKGGETAEERREADLRRREEIENRLRVEREKRDHLRRMAEADILAAARGDEVVTDTSGVRRILDHDPIASLTWLSADQDEAAKALRDCYEMRAVDVGAVEYTGMPGGDHNHEHFVAKRYERAKATLLIGQVATAILVGTFRSQRGSLILIRSHVRFEAEKVLPPLALGMIQAVCGHGLTLTSQGAGRAYDRNRRALALGLDVAHEVMKG